MIVVLPAARHAMAADSAASLIEAASRAASAAVTWEAEGRLVTQESADEGSLRTEAAFRIVIERVPSQRARIEITGVPAPVTRVCDGSLQWGYLPAAKQYWTLKSARIDACAEPFHEWPYLAADLHDPVIIGQAQLHFGDRFIDCTVVRGDYAGADASRSGKRSLWIEDVTNTIWQYRVERGTTGLASSVEPAVRIYTLLRQTRDGIRQPGDFAMQPPEGCEKLFRIPELRLGDGAPLPAKDHVEPPGIGANVNPPEVVDKVAPEYSEAARRARIEGTVILYIEVWPDGKAHDIRVLRSLEASLDQKAIEAVSQWQFRPGMKDGVPVKVAAQIEVNFRLLKKKKD